MKIDRLLGIVIYLLNRDIVSGNLLAERFEVSLRTVQRDIETLSLAGIPITSVRGIDGGYSIIKDFKLNSQMVNTEDYIYIITALKGLSSAYKNYQIEYIIEKVTSLLPPDSVQNIQLDFSVLREGFLVADYLESIEKAIRGKQVIRFDYTNADKQTHSRVVEPVIINYKWYSWYLSAFCQHKQDYRLFRLSRIRNLELTNQSFSREHKNPEYLFLRNYDQRKYMDVKLLCPANLRVSIEEAFTNADISPINDNQLIVEFSVPANEKGWFGTLLAYADEVTVLAPEELKELLVKHAQEILKKYI